jgi:hypothetical protein
MRRHAGPRYFGNETRMDELTTGRKQTRKQIASDQQRNPARERDTNTNLRIYESTNTRAHVQRYILHSTFYILHSTINVV